MRRKRGSRINKTPSSGRRLAACYQCVSPYFIYRAAGRMKKDKGIFPQVYDKGSLNILILQDVSSGMQLEQLHGWIFFTVF
jgi:hypothetical protein